MSRPTAFVIAVYFAILVNTFGVPMDGAGGQEKFEIQLYINGKIVSWNIINWSSNKTVGDVVKAIRDYGKIFDKSQTKPTLPTGSGYRGYVINHHGVGVHNHHEWVLPRCKKPTLEEAILIYTPTSGEPVIQYLAQLKKVTQSCPGKLKQK